ncbi:hypothetical protein GCM10010215_74840 [Streptomyces virginiae]|uniref:Uncharacterized protein n=1 Tax=Streptomyces virginiae TaxID=1961 RepID=A0ABQ3NNV4_STRVG|nr:MULTISPECIES: hypothetical protein [Streptomyces]GLV96328.1 hypothetical protein Slala04_77810 [Streptomyces lavendulae subsp. lavendulae]KOU14462.1 hypothetical protein ADK49_23475 [Streptomyces sp. WM6349]KOV54660.1 hypothetical protein ADK98_03490 [Streptomyces sp. H036]MBP2341676.1 hypothetical protein [Streptomyces virginiae]MCI4079375.1 hypothetical protein [Streptomyces sp. MMS21 TC-5]
MPGSDKPMSDGSEDDGAPPVRGEGCSTARDVLLAGVAQALLAGLADEAAHWIVQFVVWLYEMLVSRL